MTRMERRRSRSRRRRRQILVATLVTALFVSICNALVADAGSNELVQELEPSYRATSSDFMEDIGILQLSEAEEKPATGAEYEKLYTEQDVIAMAQMVYGEGWVTQSDTEMSWIMWCVCNRFCSGDPFYRDCESLYDIITQYYGTNSQQFHGYDPSNPVEERLVNLARDVLDRWSAEKQGATDVGRTLPAECLYFWGDGQHNYFTTEWQGGIEYDGHLGTPYDN